MISDTVRVLIKKYTHLCSWFVIREGDNSLTTKKFEAVLNEIGRLETELVKNGVSELAIDKLISYVKENSLTEGPIEDLTENQQLRLCKAIFGVGTHWQE